MTIATHSGLNQALNDVVSTSASLAATADAALAATSEAFGSPAFGALATAAMKANALALASKRLRSFVDVDETTFMRHVYSPVYTAQDASTNVAGIVSDLATLRTRVGDIDTWLVAGHIVGPQFGVIDGDMTHVHEAAGVAQPYADLRQLFAHALTATRAM